MAYLDFSLFSLLLAWLLATACLPFLALRDRSLAASGRRSLYDKSAGQIRHLAAWMQVLVAAALSADCLAGGAVAHFARGGARPFLWGMTGCAVVAAVLSVACVMASRRSARSAAGAALCLGAGGGALASAVAGVFLAWGFLRGLPETATGSEFFRAVVSGPDLFPAAAFGLFCLALAAAAGQGAGLVWHILRRRADDFGRDYYAFVSHVRARRAAYAGALLLPFGAALLWLTPVLSPKVASGLGWSAAATRWALGIGALGLPLAVACWYGMARAEAPLRRKSLAFLALPLLWAGVVCLLMRLWA